MLYLISGASASGKKTIGPRVAAELDGLKYHNGNERMSNNRAEGLKIHASWIGDALRLEREGVDLLLASQSPLGVVLAVPQAIEVSAIATCLLDCHDYVRVPRMLARGIDPRWPLGMDTLCWAVFHRMHARNPQWEQRVLKDSALADYEWERWTGWNAEDPRWDVPVFDNTTESVDETVDAVSSWIERIRREGAPLTRTQPNTTGSQRQPED